MGPLTTSSKLAMRSDLIFIVVAVFFCFFFFFPFIQALSKVLLELRAEMTAAAEQKVVAGAAQKEETLNVQMLLDKHTKDLKVGNPRRNNADVVCCYCLNATEDTGRRTSVVILEKT